MELSALTRALRRHWRAALLTFIVLAVAAQLAAFLPDRRYEATAVVSVQPAGEGVSTQLISFLVPSLEARVSGPSLRADVVQRLPAELRRADWGVTTTVPPDSGVLRISVESTDARVPVVAANAYADVLAAEDLGVDALSVLLIDAASETSTISSRAVVLVSGLGLAVIVAGLVALAAAALSSRPRTWDGRHVVNERWVQPLPSSTRTGDQPAKISSHAR